MKQSNALYKHFCKADLMALYINYGLFALAIGLSFWYGTLMAALIIGGGTIAAVTIIYNIAKGSLLSRITMGAAYMVMTALHIHQAHGMIEFHFGVFALLAMLLYYRDWIPIVAAAGVIAVHHVSFFVFQSVYGMDVWVLEATGQSFLVILLHAAYVVVETACLAWFAIDLKKEATQGLEVTDATNKIIQEDGFDLCVRTSGSTSMLQEFDKYTHHVEAMTSEVKTSAGTLSQEGNALNHVLNEMTSSANNQQDIISQLTNEVTEMKTSVENVNQNAKDAAETSATVDSSAEEATQISQDTQNSVQTLASKVSERPR